MPRNPDHPVHSFQDTKGKFIKGKSGNPKGRPNRKHYSGENECNKFLNYGLRDKDYDQMLKDQDGKCAICGTSSSGGRFKKDGTRYGFAIDHEHVEGYKNMSPELKRTYVRGLLCYRCNSIVVRILEEEKELVKRAQEYLEKYSSINRGGFKQKKLW